MTSARQAQLSVVEASIQRELEDERIKAQLTIDIRKAGGDQEAIDAANRRAKEGFERLAERDELNALMVEAEKRVREHYAHEMAVVTAHWDAKDALVKVRHRGELATMESAHYIQRLLLKTDLNEILSTWTAHFDQKLIAMKEAHANELGETISYVEHINETTLQLLDRTVTIRTVHVTEQRDEIVPETPPGWPPGGRPDFLRNFLGNRQHGGPVLTGRPYMVGEAGPEMFVPSQPGRIEANGGGGGAADPQVLAQAVKDSLEGTAIEVDGRRLGRLTIRHQPLAVAELGGRR